MNRAFRHCMLAAGAAAFLSTQAAIAAAPVAQSAAVDPLVSVSVLGTPQSHAAVCGAGQGVASACVVPGTAAASTAALGMASLQNGDDPKSISWPLIIGLIVLIIIGALLISGGGDGDGDLTPISPN